MDKHLDAEALGDYAEGLAEAPARAAADAHLAECAHCRRELAAIQAYFREMADLEPARAPADFLARVRARLPRPSPWERVWAAFLLPFRSIPVPIAVAVILGVTAITVYMRQGGPETRALAPAPVAAPTSESVSESESESGSDSESASGSPSGAAAQSTEPAADGNPAPARPKAVWAERKRSGPPRSESLPAIPGEGAGSAAASPAPETPAPSISDQATSAPPASQPPVSAPTASPGLPEAKASPAKPAPFPSQTRSSGAAKKPRDAEAIGWLDNPSAVYIQGNSSGAADLPLDKTMPVAEENAVPGQAEAAAGHAAKRKAENESKEEDGRFQAAPGKHAAPVPSPASGYALSLRAKADTAAVLAGLRSMGVEAEPEYASSGENRYRLKVPGAMLRELGPYLARHGESRPEGQLPSAGSGSVLSIRLRLLFPAR